MSILNKAKKILKGNHFVKMCSLSIFWFFTDYIYNYWITYIPIWQVRKLYLRLFSCKIGKRSRIDMKCSIQDPNLLTIGSYCHINRSAVIDARGQIIIGNCVSISQQVSLVTGSHDIYKPTFPLLRNSIVIDDYVWIGFRATILGGVHIGKGAVICSGAIVTKDIEAFGIYAGIPAKKIGERPSELNYKPLEEEYFWPMFT